MSVCPECHEPLIRSVSRPGALICPSAWGECAVSGRALDVVRRAA